MGAGGGAGGCDGGGWALVDGRGGATGWSQVGGGSSSQSGLSAVTLVFLVRCLRVRWGASLGDAVVVVLVLLLYTKMGVSFYSLVVRTVLVLGQLVPKCCRFPGILAI